MLNIQLMILLKMTRANVGAKFYSLGLERQLYLLNYLYQFDAPPKDYVSKVSPGDDQGEVFLPRGSAANAQLLLLKAFSLQKVDALSSRRQMIVKHMSSTTAKWETYLKRNGP